MRCFSELLPSIYARHPVRQNELAANIIPRFLGLPEGSQAQKSKELVTSLSLCWTRSEFDRATTMRISVYPWRGWRETNVDKSPMPPPQRFELVGQQSDLSGNLRLRYGSNPQDTQSFVLTLTPHYVARDLKNGQPITIIEIEQYAHDNAGELRAKAVFGKEFGLVTLVLD